MRDLKELFQEHIQTLQARTEKVLSHTNYPGIVINAADELFYYVDDMAYTYKPTPHFRYFCPSKGINHKLVIRPGQKPKLYYYKPSDFWEEFEDIGDEYWVDSFEIEVVSDKNLLWKKIENYQSFAFVGPEHQKLGNAKLADNPQSLVNGLDWERSFKTPYEIECTKRANEIGAKGHIAAQKSFFEGGSERDIFMAYVQGTGQLETEHPYPAIVGVNDKSAILHYRRKRTAPKNGALLLLDAGATYQGYASDITRTSLTDAAPKELHEIKKRLNEVQLQLCDSVKPDLPCRDFLYDSQKKVTQILLDMDILRGVNPEEAVTNRFTRCFYPHGLSHMLGIQVHDVAGRQASQFQDNILKKESGGIQNRNQRNLGVGNIITIEPGIYFNETLLGPVRPNTENFNWEIIDRLIPFGGMRIEDNVVVTEGKATNLTRSFLPE